jgi:hypothetical protein
MLTKNLMGLSHVLFATLFCALKLMQCQIWSARLAKIVFTHHAFTNGFKAVERANVFFANSHGVELKFKVVASNNVLAEQM